MISFFRPNLKLFFAQVGLALFASSGYAVTKIQAPIVIDGITLEEVTVSFSDPLKDLTISKADADRILGPLIKDSKWNRLQASENLNNQWISLGELNRIDVNCLWDEPSVSIICIVPLDVRKVQDLSILRSLIRPGAVLDSSAFSGYMNLSAIKSFTGTNSATAPDRTVLDPLQAQAELVQHFNQVTLESTAYYLENQKNPWQRGDTSLVYDYQPSSIRFRLGDFNQPTLGYLSSVSMGGLLIQKQFAIDPLNPATALRSTTIYLKNPSLIELSVNRILITRLRLPAGSFNLKDLPLLNGRNKVDVKVTDDFGAVQEFSVNLFFEGTLLGKGIHDYAYSSGQPSEIIEREKQYRSQNLSTFFHRYGLSDQWTLGLNGQNLDQKNLVGLETSFLLPRAYIQFDQAFSKNETANGLASHLRIKSADQLEGDLAKTRVFADLQTKSKEFSQVSVGAPVYSEYSAKAELFTQTNLSQKVNLNLGGGYQWGQNNFDDARLYRASVQWALPENIRFDVSYNQTVRSQTEDQWLLNLTWFEPKGLYSASGNYDSTSQSTNLNFHRNAVRINNDYAADINAQQSPDIHSIEAKANYYASTYELQAGHQYQYQRPLSETTNRSQIGASTAMAWGSGHFSFSRPITDSFALLATNEVPDSGYLVINPDTEFSEATMDSWKTLVLPNLTAYQKSTLIIDSTHLPAGTTLQKESYLLKPQYRGGIFVDLSLEKAILAIGYLKKQNNDPLDFISGSIYNEKNQLITDSFFTDGQGRFMIDQLKAGTYKIILHEAGWKEIILTLDPKDQHQINLGVIQVDRKEGM